MLRARASSCTVVRGALRVLVVLLALVDALLSMGREGEHRVVVAFEEGGGHGEHDRGVGVGVVLGDVCVGGLVGFRFRGVGPLEGFSTAPADEPMRLVVGEIGVVGGHRTLMMLILSLRNVKGCVMGSRPARP